jgi:hypothetical protein
MVRMNRGEMQRKFLADTVGIDSGRLKVDNPDGVVTAEGLGCYAATYGHGLASNEGALNPKEHGAMSGVSKKVSVTGGK